jgi:hypothetical protein
MKIHNDFTLYFWVTPSWKRIVYFYAYDENSRRMRGRSIYRVDYKNGGKGASKQAF